MIPLSAVWLRTLSGVSPCGDIPTDQIVYFVVRMDPKKVLPAGYAFNPRR